MWLLLMLDFFVKEVVYGVLINRVVSEVEIGSFIRGGCLFIYVVKVENGYVINGVKIFIFMSKVLIYYIVGVYVEEIKLMGFFLIF